MCMLMCACVSVYMFMCACVHAYICVYVVKYDYLYTINMLINVILYFQYYLRINLYCLDENLFILDLFFKQKKYNKLYKHIKVILCVCVCVCVCVLETP